MPVIVPFIRANGQFDDEVTRVMGDAYDAARKELHISGQRPEVYAAMAKCIIAAAKTGERDPLRLRDVALAGFPRAAQ